MSVLIGLGILWLVALVLAVVIFGPQFYHDWRLERELNGDHEKIQEYYGRDALKIG